MIEIITKKEQNYLHISVLVEKTNKSLHNMEKKINAAKKTFIVANL